MPSATRFQYPLEFGTLKIEAGKADALNSCPGLLVRYSTLWQRLREDQTSSGLEEVKIVRRAGESAI
jgi:hypothetical protein